MSIWLTGWIERWLSDRVIGSVTGWLCVYEVKASLTIAPITSSRNAYVKMGELFIEMLFTMSNWLSLWSRASA